MHTDAAPLQEACARFRTGRQKKRLVKKDHDKQLLYISRQETGLYKQIRSLPMAPLKKPYQRGWKRSFVLREDVARNAQAAFYAALLLKVNTTEYAPAKDFTRKRRRRGRKFREVRP